MVSLLARRSFLQASRSIRDTKCTRTTWATRKFTTNSSTSPDFGFVFDIDGVLLRSSKALPGAHEAISTLQKHKIPFVFLTNGGGKLESERIQQLSKLLRAPLDSSLLIQSHTPYASLATPDELQDKHILVIGGNGDKCRKVAESYGFRNVIIPSDIFNACPEIWPFSAQFANYHAAAAKPLPLPLYVPSSSHSKPIHGEHLKIDAMFVYNDPRDMGLDTQLVLDLLLSDQGFLGTISDKNGNKDLPNHGYLAASQPLLYFANPDLVWAAKYHLPRFGSGAFKASLSGLWRELTGSEQVKMHIIEGGKPNQSAYSFAETKLSHLWQQLHESTTIHTSPKRIYMVGDNIASDIIGANQFKSSRDWSWSTYLVRSGVWSGKEPSNALERPSNVVDGVNEAVQSILAQESWTSDTHSKECSQSGHVGHLLDSIS